MPPVKSGYYYPNKFARIFLDAMEEVMGKKHPLYGQALGNIAAAHRVF